MAITTDLGLKKFGRFIFSKSSLCMYFSRIRLCAWHLYIECSSSSIIEQISQVRLSKLVFGIVYHPVSILSLCEDSLHLVMVVRLMSSKHELYNKCGYVIPMIDRYCMIMVDSEVWSRDFLSVTFRLELFSCKFLSYWHKFVSCCIKHKFHISFINASSFLVLLIFLLKLYCLSLIIATISGLSSSWYIKSFVVPLLTPRHLFNALLSMVSNAVSYTHLTLPTT